MRIEHGAGHHWQSTSVAGEQAIDHESILGEVEVVNDRVNVRVAQRVDFDLLAEPVRVSVGAPRITLGQMFEMTAGQAEQIAELLVRAVHFVDTLPPTRP